MNLANLDFLKLDPRYFKAFIAAAEYENFSVAATQAAMTQSGISQHISKLEDQLAVSLFMRSSKATVLTEEGKALLSYIRSYNDSIQSLIETINKERKFIEGLVSYAMPPSCLLSPHFPMLLERRLNYPDLELKVELLPNDDILPLVIDGKIDFGFVTEKVEHPLLSYQKFCDEEYIFVGADAAGIKSLNAENLLSQKFINYPGMGVYFNYWKKHYLPECVNISDRSLHHAGEMNSIEGAIHMVAGSLGLSVFPRHCVQHHIESEKLFEYIDTSRPPLTNTIHIVTRKHPELPARVTTVIDWFLDMHRNDPK
ncbi:transcriptional regulator, LysR family [Alteromonadaceae bacterium Bs31]|nr:transcriptional regulator, LysR family [Alteromonadaceae bacterium Bs31]